MAPLGLPTATVIRARGKFSRTARSAGRLITTSPSWPKSMMRILRGSKLIGNAKGQAGAPDLAANGADSLALLQMLIKKVRARAIGQHPVLVQQQIVNLIGKNQFFEI